MARLRNCSRCRGSLLTIEENEMFGGWLVICTNCGWANEGGDRQDAIDQWNEAHGGKNGRDNKGTEKSD
jgi:hypothetical protein